MSREQSLIEGSAGPVTIESLFGELRGLGIEPGEVLMVHSSLSSMGWVAGGPVSLILALELVLSREGTLIMPTHSTQLSDPGAWQNPPVPADWVPILREQLPPFDPDLTPTRGMGAIPECFRGQKGTLRSEHPLYSFAAWGAQARVITSRHRLDRGLGQGSPMQALYELDGRVLLVGVGYDRATCLHLAEDRARWPGRKTVRQGGPILARGGREWASWDEPDWDHDDFAALGAAFEAASPDSVVRGQLGQAACRLVRVRELIDFAVAWLEIERGEA